MPALLDMNPSEALDRIFSVRSRIELDHLPREKHADVHPLVRRLCAKADTFSAIEYGAATDVMEGVKARIIARTSGFDYVLAPVLPTVNFPAEQVAPDPEEPMSLASFTSMFNQTGQPAASVCCGFDERGLPIGLQIIGRRFDDRGVLALAHAYETVRGFTPQWPE
jgi:Asp-tRNA(Asn)/Glu-tRNA(Gln) amidotransferase A subunit family amidase